MRQSNRDSPAQTSVPSPGGSGALSTFRICDFTGQLAGAGATKWLAAFGAEVIRIEDPVRQGRWDILRGGPPYKDGERGLDRGGAFNNHNAGKYGITLNLRDERAKDILARLIEISDVVSENFAKGVLERWGFGYERMREIRGDIIYVSNCGFGHVGPYSDFKTWGPIVQAVSGLTFTNGLPDREPAGWGYSYMDHTGGYYMAMAILLALVASPAHGRRPVGGSGLHGIRPRAARTCLARLDRERTSEPPRGAVRTAIATPGHRWRRTASIDAPATTSGLPSPVAMTATGGGWRASSPSPGVPSRASRSMQGGSRTRTLSTPISNAGPQAVASSTCRSACAPPAYLWRRCRSRKSASISIHPPRALACGRPSSTP